MMEDGNTVWPAMEESEQTEAQAPTNNRPKWSNGQCVLAMPSSSAFNPNFDVSLCCAALERNGFQIPITDIVAPLKSALEVPSVRRYMVFNSALFHFIMAPVLYVVLWCAVFSTLHLYISISDYWVLCLCVSLVSIFLTTAIIFVLHHSNKEINMNLDVRLIQVNERLVKHKLLVAVADWVQNCTGNLQLYFVYWDMAHCLRTLTETLERNFVANDNQNKVKKTMSHLVLVTEVLVADAEDAGTDVEQASDEHSHLLTADDTGNSSSPSSPGDAKVTINHSLVPDASLPAQLLVSQRLSGPSHHRLRPRRNHCNNAPFCLCQYIKTKILR
ncbi:transmembrane protein 268 isoform 2-T2 [Aulostomus maculatus]